MADVYKIAVALTMAGNAPAFLSALGTQLLHVHTKVKDLEGGLTRLSRIKLAVGGGLAIAGGAAGLAMVGKMVDRGNELVKIQQNMAAAGVKATEVQEAYAKAWTLTGKYQNVGAAEALKVISEARMTFGSQHDATHHAEDFVKMVSFLKAFQGGKHGEGAANFEAEAIAAMKSGEIAGKVSPAEMAEHVKQLTAMRVAYGDQLKIGQYLTAQRAAGVALRNTSDAFRYGMFPALVQENGQSAGTMLMTAFNKIVAGTGNRTRSLEHMADIGLLHRDQLLYDKAGRIKGLKDPSAIKDNKNAAMNFGDWVMGTLRPMLDKRLDKEGITGQDRAIREAQLISAMFPDRNAAKAITEVLQQFNKLQKDAAQQLAARKALDESAYLDKSWEGQKQAFETQWHNLLDALGAPMVAQATSMLRDFNQTLAGVSQWAGLKENAEAVSNIFKGVAIGAAALTGAGAVALLAAIGPAGWFAAGVIALGGAFLAFQPQMEKALASMAGLKPEELDRVDKEFDRYVEKLTDWAKNLPFDQIIQAHLDYGMRLNKWLQSWVPSIGLDFFGGGDGKDKEKGGGQGGAMSAFVQAFAKNLEEQWNTAASAITTTLNATKSVWSLAISEMKTWPDLASGTLKAAWEGLKPAFEAAVAEVKTWPNLLQNEIASWPSRLAEAIAGMGTAVIGKIKEAINPLNWIANGAADQSRPPTSLNPGDELPGIQKQSFNGGAFRDLVQNAAFGSSGGSMSDAVYSGVLRALNEVMGKGGGATGMGGGLGGLIQNASLGGGGAANDNGGSSVGRALGGGSGGGGGNGVIPALPSSVQMTPAERNTLGLIMQHESHGRNTMNYMGRAQGLSPTTARGYTAQGYFQMLNSNWRRIAPRLGISAPNAMAGSLEDQTRVALELLRKGGIQNWSNYNPALRNALRRGDRAPVGSSAAPAPTAGPPPRQEAPQAQSVELHVDGRRMAGVVVKHVAAAGKFPRHTGGMDTHGSWRPPGTTLTDAA